MRNETTSKKVATIAGRLSRFLAKAEKNGCTYLFTSDGGHIADAQAVISSALTQTKDKKK